MSEFGFDEIEFDDEEEPEEDDFDGELPEEPKAKFGDIYKLGRHRLMCGDSTDAEDVETLMAGAWADMALTDPPYNVDYTGKNEEQMKIENDAMSDENFTGFLTVAFENIEHSLKDGGAFYIWYASQKYRYFDEALRRTGLEEKAQLIWNKNVFAFGRQDYQWKHEPCLYGWKGGAAHYFTDDRTQSTVINEDKPSANTLHPTMKPIKLMGRLIKNSSRQNEIILDIFGGSGSTLIACEQLNRTCYMMELDPKYIDVIIERWETFTGEKAEKLTE